MIDRKLCIRLSKGELLEKFDILSEGLGFIDEIVLAESNRAFITLPDFDNSVYKFEGIIKDDLSIIYSE